MCDQVFMLSKGTIATNTVTATCNPCVKRKTYKLQQDSELAVCDTDTLITLSM